MKEQKKCVPEIRFAGFTDDWELRKLGEVADVEMCKRIFKHQTTPFGTVPFFKIGTFGGVADAYISRQLFDEYRRKYPFPKETDILVSASGTIGKTVIYNGEIAYYQDSNIIWLNINKSKLCNIFLRYLYETINWNKIEGSTIKRLYNSDILSTKVHLPCLTEQTAIGNFFKQLDDTIALHQKELAKYQQIKAACLEKMFVK